jgi:hypothetical protein
MMLPYVLPKIKDRVELSQAGSKRAITLGIRPQIGYRAGPLFIYQGISTAKPEKAFK